jgi:alkylhydroperoxidase family enzyme
VYARAAGLDDAEIERIADGPNEPGWSDEERWLLVAADELVDGHDLREETWNALRERFEPAQLVEIPFVVGQYTMLSMVANATGVAVEAGLPALPERPAAGR